MRTQDRMRRGSGSDVSFLAMTTFFNNGDRVLAPDPNDPSGALRAAKMYGPGADVPGTQVSVQFENGNGSAVNVPADRVVKLS